MDAQDLRALGRRCRELLNVAVSPGLKEQLREWVDDCEAEAEAIDNEAQENSAPSGGAVRPDGNFQGDRVRHSTRVSSAENQPSGDQKRR